MHPDLTTLPGRGSLVVACAECSAPFRVFPSFLVSRPTPTCSRACRSASRRRAANERNARDCVVCGTTFYPAPHAVREQNRRACSLACRAEWQRGRTAAKTDPVARFLEKVVKGDGCWGWKGSTNFGDHGYGAFFDGSRLIGAHRYAWMLATGETLAPGDVIGHTCDTPPCTRNDDEGTYEVAGVVLPRRGHLFKCSDADNARDMFAKGRERTTSIPGESNPNARLTEDAVRSIRRDHARGTALADLAIRHGITRTMVSFIVRRKSWKHVE